MRVEVRGNLDALRTRARQVREGARLAAPNDMPREAGRLQVNPVAVPRLRHRPSGFYAIRETRSTSRAHRTFRNGVILLAHAEGSQRWFRVLSCRPIHRTCCRRVMSCRHRWRCESQISHQTWFGCTVSARGMAHASIKSRSFIDSHAGKLARQQDVGRRPARRRPRGTYSHGVHAPCVGLLSHDFSAKLPGHAA